MSVDELMARSNIVWQIRADQEISDVCTRAEEFMMYAARTCSQAVDVMKRMRDEESRQIDLSTALKKYVEDTCEAIKQVDNLLKSRGSDLGALLFEIPERARDQVSWRNLIGRRDVIAHNLLTVDDERVHREAERDFGLLKKLVSRVFFVPIKTNCRNGHLNVPLPPLRTELLHDLDPAEPGTLPGIGASLVFIAEDTTIGFSYLRMGRTKENQLLLAGPPGTTANVSCIAW
ncbi:MAG: hypothetical protein F4X11_24090 [Acidobacteria bacterium]|nr:hypothetical protein [Acidobacteriota bacterium]